MFQIKGVFSWECFNCIPRRYAKQLQTRLQCQISNVCHSFHKHLPGHLMTCNSKRVHNIVFLRLTDMGYEFPLEAAIQSRWPPYLYEAQPYQNPSSSPALLHATDWSTPETKITTKQANEKNQCVLCGSQHLDVLPAHLKSRKGGWGQECSLCHSIILWYLRCLLDTLPTLALLQYQFLPP